MSDCAYIDPLVTPYIDGELADHDRHRVDAHLHGCASCRSRVDAERSACRLLRQRRVELTGLAAPAALLTRCRAAQRTAPASVVPFRPAAPRSVFRVSRLAAAAMFVLAVGGGLVYRATIGATQAMAAELAADHVKCFMMNTVLRTHESLDDVEAYMRSGFDWAAELPEHADHEGMELVGSRPCLYEHGKVAHIMYRHKGVPVSIFMIPGSHHEAELTHAFGHDAVIWSDERRTFVLIAKAPHDEVEKVATFVRASLH